jgi:monoterpene epsilon-lactone hydrolase
MNPEWPDTISPQAQQMMAAIDAMPPPDPAMDPMRMRTTIEAMQHNLAQPQLERYGVTVENAEMGGVPVRIFAPPPGSGGPPLSAASKMLLNLHGGGFVLDSGSMTENIAMAALTGLPVVAVLYRLAPEHPFPAAVDDALTVYRELLATRDAGRIGLYGTSAGAGLSAQLVARLLKEGLPIPRAMGFFSGTADLARDGDSEAWLPRLPTGTVVESLSPYCGDTPRRDPALSPIFGDLSRFPPTLVMASTRDQLMSQSALFHRALLNGGVEAELVIFESLPHAFWAYLAIPETDEAFGHMARFFTRHMR